MFLKFMPGKVKCYSIGILLRFLMTHNYKSALFKDFKSLKANIFQYLCQINPQMGVPEMRII